MVKLFFAQWSLAMPSPNVNDIYSGILAPNGGLYKPGPPVVMPGAPKKTTAEGLAINSVHTTQVDTRGNPIVPKPQNQNAALAAALIDQMNQHDVVRSVPASPPVAPRAPSTTNGANPIDGYRLALTPTPKVAPAVSAIQSATQHGAAFNPGTWGSGGLLDFVHEAAAPAPAGDPWASDRLGGEPVTQQLGLVTSNSVKLPAPVATSAIAFPKAPKAPLTYDPRVDVTGVKNQHNAGGWGINAGGGIVA